MLNEAQHRRVAVTMRRLETVLSDQRRLLETEPPLALTERIMDVPSDVAAALRTLNDAVLQEVREIASTCGLRPIQQSTRRMLESELSVQWADVEDTRPEKLHGFGDVTHEAMDRLGPPIDRIVGLLQSMQVLLERTGDTALL